MKKEIKINRDDDGSIVSISYGNVLIESPEHLNLFIGYIQKLTDDIELSIDSDRRVKIHVDSLTDNFTSYEISFRTHWLGEFTAKCLKTNNTWAEEVYLGQLTKIFEEVEKWCGGFKW